MSSIKDQQKAITDRGTGVFKSWIESIKFRKGDGLLTILIKIFRAILGCLIIIILSPVILLLLILTIAIAL